jgi:hypothetical protein
LAALHESANGRFCCKSLFALVFKIAFGCTRDFRVSVPTPLSLMALKRPEIKPRAPRRPPSDRGNPCFGTDGSYALGALPVARRLLRRRRQANGSLHEAGRQAIA